MVSAEARREIANMVRRNCTPSGEAYARGGDALIRAVADWIENPPEWVNAPVVVSTEVTSTASRSADGSSDR